MDLNVITVSETEARAKVAEYVRAVRERHDHEDEAILRGYRAIAKGQKVLSLPDAIERGGWDRDLRPRLAIARADTKDVHLRFDYVHSAALEGRRRIVFSEKRYAATSRARKLGATITVDVVGYAPGMEIGHRQSSKAVVPLVPPALRPSSSLMNYHILFEAEWRDTPPKDPALLRHLGGDLWAVCATWDLTDLEMTVLAGRRRMQ